MPLTNKTRLRVDGRFFMSGEERVFIRCVTLGPFPPEKCLEDELEEIANVGFNSVRLYEPPTRDFLDRAAQLNLWVFASVPWGWGIDFIGNHGDLEDAKKNTLRFLQELGDHPAIAGLYIANEIPVDVIRWNGVAKIKQSLERLIRIFRNAYPDLLYAYANFPTTEYLELENADFTAFNIYLEQEDSLRSYLKHLHLVSGHRPLIISEFGADRLSHNTSAYSHIHEMVWRSSLEEGCAGLTIFAWSDVWWNRNQLVEGWQFGLTTSEGRQQPETQFVTTRLSLPTPSDLISVIVCTYNGENRIHDCLKALLDLNDSHYEVLIVDDGSDDSTHRVAKEFVSHFQEKERRYQIVRQQNSGLSHARNHGAQLAQGSILAYTDDDARPDRDWLHWIRVGFRENPNAGIVGGYGIVPRDFAHHEFRFFPGQACPVLNSDNDAEHLPGCNMVVKKEVWQNVGGFSEQYRRAGDDVDFCWRVLDGGKMLIFHPCAYVWHEMRPTIMEYLKQQWGYGHAEALLYRDHPARFSTTGIRWNGSIYTSEPIVAHHGSIIYEGHAGTALFQPIVSHSQSENIPLKAKIVAIIQPWVRAIARWRNGFPIRWTQLAKLCSLRSPYKRQQQGRSRKRIRTLWRAEPTDRLSLLDVFTQAGWVLIENSQWDLESDGTKVKLLLEQPHETGQYVKICGNGLAAAIELLEKNDWNTV